MSTQGTLCAKLHSVFDPLEQQFKSLNLQSRLEEYIKTGVDIDSVTYRGITSLVQQKIQFIESIYKPAVESYFQTWYSLHKKWLTGPLELFPNFWDVIHIDTDGRVIFKDNLLLQYPEDQSTLAYPSIIKEIQGYFSSPPDIDLTGLERVTGSFGNNFSREGTQIIAPDLKYVYAISVRDIKKLSFPVLEEVAGDIYIKNSSDDLETEVEMPSLRVITGSLDGEVISSGRFDSLEEIGECLFLKKLTGSFREVFPSLKRVKNDKDEFIPIQVGTEEMRREILALREKGEIEVSQFIRVGPLSLSL